MVLTHLQSNQPYPRHDEIVDALSARAAPRRLDDVVLVPTDVLLPNGTNVVAVVEGGRAGERFTVTDAGSALGQVSEAGLDVSRRVMSAARTAARQRGATLEGSSVRFGPVPISEIAEAVIMLANTALEVARTALQAARRHEQDRFRARLKVELDRIFRDGSVLSGAVLQGASTDKHRFDYLVGLSGGIKIVLDAPVPDHGSVAAVTLRQLDLMAANIPGVLQAIAYDDNDRWPSSTLMQLRLARVPVIQAGELEVGLKRVVGGG